MLLVLDNCEHLAAACVDLLLPILRSGTRARILATSREPLGVSGEQVWQVPLLSVPPTANSRIANSHAASPARLQEIMQSAAARLFDERARMVAPSFAITSQNAEAVAQICQRLEGIPLAIELAAARANILTPQQIAERLENSVHLLTRGAATSPARHQTLRAALDWSYGLLLAAEQTLFTRLSVFAGSFSVDAIEGVCAGDGLGVNEILDLLANLVEKSLVVVLDQTAQRYPEMRYRLLVPVRHYAAEQLRATGGENSWRGRHARWYLTFAQRAAPELEGADQSVWLDRIEIEHDNLRAALAWFAATPEGTESGLPLSNAIALFWCIRSHLSEGQRWLELFLERIDPQKAQPAQVAALNCLARITFLQSNFQAARAHYERSLLLGREIEYDDGVETGLIGMGVTLWELGDFQKARATLEDAVRYTRAAHHLKSLARALNHLGLVCMHQGDHQATRATLTECLAINQQLGHKTGIATVLFNLAMLAGQDGDYTRARLLYEEALALDRELGNRTTAADALNNMGGLAVQQGDLAAGAAYFEEAAHIYREIGAMGDTAYTTTGLGDIAFHQGNYAEARTRYGEALALFREASNQRLLGRVLGQLGRIACREGNLLAAAALAGESMTIRRTIGHQPGMVFGLEQSYVELAVAANQPLVAARLLGAAESARKALARPREPIETRHLEPYLARLREQMDGQTLQTVWAEGETMRLDEAVAYALDTLSTASLAQARPAVRFYALGQARVYRGDRLLTSADWTYAKARELIFYLLTHPNATREQIGLDFWPDASAEQVRKRFSAALAHARSALGRDQEWILQQQGRYQINPERAYWYDVELFEAKAQRAAQLLQDSAPREQIIELLEESIKFYQGDFVEEFVEGEWHQARRAVLLRAYLDALLALGSLHFQAERYAQTMILCQRALAKDPYLEEAHYALIRCYARMHKRSLALRQYETLVAALGELNATPSPETQQLIEQVRLGDSLV
jgi:predicted ATPase/DNA-binding SARP family transcriptional activator